MIARGKFVFSYLLGLSKKRTSRDCDLHETTFVTTTDNGDTKEETKKDIRIYSGETVGVAFWSDPSQYLR